MCVCVCVNLCACVSMCACSSACVRTALMHVCVINFGVLVAKAHTWRTCRQQQGRLKDCVWSPIQFAAGKLVGILISQIHTQILLGWLVIADQNHFCS